MGGRSSWQLSGGTMCLEERMEEANVGCDRNCSEKVTGRDRGAWRRTRTSGKKEGDREVEVEWKKAAHLCLGHTLIVTICMALEEAYLSLPS